jgi:hypothetical protein
MGSFPVMLEVSTSEAVYGASGRVALWAVCEEGVIWQELRENSAG